MRSKLLTLFIVLAPLLVIPVNRGVAQDGPEAGKKVTVTVWSDDDCMARNATFAIPPGWMGTEVSDAINSNFMQCEGPESPSRVDYYVTGPVSWRRGITKMREPYGDELPEILPAGTYQMQVGAHGKGDSFELRFVLQPAGCKVEEKSVSAWSDSDCGAHASPFVIPAGCVATDIRVTTNTSFSPCEGPGHTDRVGYQVSGPVSWQAGVLWGGGTWGQAPPTTLPAGSYTLSPYAYGRGDSWELRYKLQPVGGGGITVPVPTVATVVAGKPGTMADLDLIFCIDVTGSMEDDIDRVKAAAVNIVDAIAKSHKDYRVAIIAYRDWNDSEGWAMFEDYAFSSSKDDIVANINRLTVGGGDDTPEAVFEALMRAIDSKAVGGWRNNVNKQIILMGDAPPHNPSREGLTPQIVAKAAEDADPVVIQAVVVGNEGYYDQEAVDAFRELAQLTGGNFFQAENAEQVPDVLRQTIQNIGSPSRTPSNIGLLMIGVLVLSLLGLVILVVVLLVIFSGRRRPAVATPAGPYSAQPPSAGRPTSPTPYASATPPHWQGQTVVTQQPVSVPQAMLVVERGTDAGRRFVLKEANRIGRAPDNDIVLSSTQVSRHHASITATGAGWMIADLGSANGVFVNGVRIQQPQLLRPNDLLTMGDDYLRFLQ